MGCAIILFGIYAVGFGSILVTGIFHPLLGVSMAAAFVWTMWTIARLRSRRRLAPAAWVLGLTLLSAVSTLTALLWLAPEASLYTPKSGTPSFDDMRFLVKIAWTTYIVGGIWLAAFGADG